jgi:hypothetical protein
MPSYLATIENYAFFGCTSLTSVSIPLYVYFIGAEAFSSCTSLPAIEVDKKNSEYASMEGVLYEKGLNTLIKCPGGKVGALTIPDGVRTIARDAFSDCPFLTIVTIPSSVDDIERFAFNNCTALKELHFEGDAPECQGGWIESHNDDLTIYYYNGSSGFTTPTWEEVKTVGLTNPNPQDDDVVDLLPIILAIVAITAIVMVVFFVIRRRRDAK